MSYKYDSGKLRLDLVPKEAVYSIARGLGFGADKYAPNQWRGGMAYSRVYAACLRHLLAWFEGEDLDKESGLSHIDHALCNLAFLATYIEHNKDCDDRYAIKRLSETNTDNSHL